MANIQINQLPGASILDGTEIFPADQGLQTVQISLNDVVNLTAESITLQQVTDVDANTTNQISALSFSTNTGGQEASYGNQQILYRNGGGAITFPTTGDFTTAFPEASGTLALLSDIPPTPSLQDVTTENNTTTDSIIVQSNTQSIQKQDSTGEIKVALSQSSNRGVVQIYNSGGNQTNLQNTLATDTREIELPDADGILAVSTTVGYSGSKTIGGQVYTWQNGILITVV